MNPFTDHPRQQGITYQEHCFLAMGIACRLFASMAVFTVHAILPFIPIERSLDLESVAAFLLERNHRIESAKGRLAGNAPPRSTVLHSIEGARSGTSEHRLMDSVLVTRNRDTEGRRSAYALQVLS